MLLNEKMNSSILLCLTIGLAVVNGRVAPASKSAENKEKRGLHGSTSSLSYGGAPSSYESSPSYSIPSNSYGSSNSYSPSESSSSYSDPSYSNSGYSSSDYSSSSDSGFKPIKSPVIEQSSSIGYSPSPAIASPLYNSHGLSAALLPSPGLDYSSLSYGSYGGLGGLGGLGHAYSGIGSAYSYPALGGFSGGLSAVPHYPRLTPVAFSGISAPYASIPIHGGIHDYSALTAAPVAPISLPAYSSASLYSSPVSSFHSLPSSYAPSHYSSPLYSSSSYGGASSSLSSYSNNKPYSSGYSSSSDYSSPLSKYPLSSSSGYSSSSYSSPNYSSLSSSNSYSAPPYSRYPSANRDSYSGSSSYSSPYKSSHAKDYNF